MFLEVFGSDSLPELDLETLDARNKLEFAKQRDYPFEHNNQGTEKEEKE